VVQSSLGSKKKPIYLGINIPDPAVLLTREPVVPPNMSVVKARVEVAVMPFFGIIARLANLGRSGRCATWDLCY
jgi:hypothetical protein